MVELTLSTRHDRRGSECRMGTAPKCSRASPERSADERARAANPWLAGRIDHCGPGGASERSGHVSNAPQGLEVRSDVRTGGCDGGLPVREHRRFQHHGRDPIPGARRILDTSGGWNSAGPDRPVVLLQEAAVALREELGGDGEIGICFDFSVDFDEPDDGVVVSCGAGFSRPRPGSSEVADAASTTAPCYG